MRAERCVAGLAALLVVAAPAWGRQQSPGAPTAAAAPPAAAKPRPAGVSLEAGAQLGITLVDFEGPQGATGPNGNFGFGVSSRLLVPAGRAMALGLEAGYQQLAVYDSFPEGGLVRVRLTSVHAAALLRFRVGKRMTEEVGAGVHFFNDGGTHPGALLGVTWRVPLGGGIEMPIVGRAQVIVAHTIMPTLEVGAGLAVGASPPVGRTSSPSPPPSRAPEPQPPPAPPRTAAALPSVRPTVPPLPRDTTIHVDPGLLAYPYLPATQLEIVGAGGSILGYPQVPDLVAALRLVFPSAWGAGIGVEGGRHMIATAGMRGFTHAAAFIRISITPRMTADVGPAIYRGDAGQLLGGGLADVEWHYPFSFGADALFGVRADLIDIHPVAIPVALSLGMGLRL